MQSLPSRQPAQSGFSLVEVMVALVVGILVLLGVVTVYLSGARTSATTEALSRVQESGRFGLYFLSENVRKAGFKSSCQYDVNILLDEGSASYDEKLFDLNIPLFGWNDQPGEFAASIPDYTGGDVLIVKTAADDSGVTLDGISDRERNDITTLAPTNIENGRIVFIGDGQGCDLFQNTAAPADRKLEKQQGGGVPGNKNTEWSRDFPDTVRVLLFESSLLYIGQGVDGRPALKRVEFNTGTATAPEELVNGIEDMQITYGEDTNADRNADRYVTADAVADWKDVVSVRVSLLAASLATNVIDQPQALPAPWDGFADPGDGRIRRVFSTTIAIRNLLL